ncbi:MAG TPA: DUF697 domain-containing protein [Tepidisphaeraceae bacterium]|nr:DUF697 domain-containing protein [Tepidisphaeraceae bacterium]
MATDTFVALGDPTQIDFSTFSAPAPAAEMPLPQVPQAESAGVPFQNQVESEPVAVEEDLLSRREVEDELGISDLEELDEGTLELWSPASLLRRSSVVLILTSLAALVMLFVFSEVVGLVGQIRNLPHIAQPAAFTVVGLLAAAVVLSLGRLVWKYLSLRASPRVSVKALGALRERAVMRRAALDGLADAQRTLEEFLVRYPLGKADQARLRKVGFSSLEIENLIQARQMLLAAPRGSAVGWIDQLNRQFIQQLDDVARRRIRLYTKMVGFKTAAVPNGALDTLIVLVNAHMMVGDLCTIYSLRAGGWGTMSIMTHIIINAFAAGRVDQWSDSAADHAANALVHHGSGMMANAVKGVSKVAARAADGYINSLLIGRLGGAAIYHLRPLVQA